MATVVIWVVLGILTALIAQSKGRRAWLWAIIGILTGVFGLLVIICMPKIKQMKKCPKCANEVNLESIVCQYCYYDFKKAAEQAYTNNNIQA